MSRNLSASAMPMSSASSHLSSAAIDSSQRSIVVRRRFRNIIAVPRRNFNHHFAGLFDHSLTSQTRVELQVGGHVEAIGLFVVHLAEQLLALLHHNVTGGAGAVAAAGVLQMQAEVHGHVQERLRLAVLLVGQLAVFKLEALVLGKERDANRVRPESFFGCRSAALCFFVWHDSFVRGPKGPLGHVPSLKGLGLMVAAYPALKRWAKIFRPCGARIVAGSGCRFTASLLHKPASNDPG